MSFKLEFTAASAAGAQAIVAQHASSIPAPVAGFIADSLAAYSDPNAPGNFVYVRVAGAVDADLSELVVEVRRVQIVAPEPSKTPGVADKLDPWRATPADPVPVEMAPADDTLLPPPATPAL